MGGYCDCIWGGFLWDGREGQPSIWSVWGRCLPSLMDFIMAFIMQVTPEMGFILCQVSTVSTCASEVCVPAGSWAGRPTAPGSVCGSEVHAGAPAVLKWRDKPSHVILCSSLNLNFWVWSHTDSVLRVLWDVSTIMLFKAFFFFVIL